MQRNAAFPAPDIKSKLSKTIAEHSELNVRVDELSGKDVMTPEEEMELKRLRKIKLFKKDMIAYLSSLVESGHGK